MLSETVEVVGVVEAVWAPTSRQDFDISHGGLPSPFALKCAGHDRGATRGATCDDLRIHE
jgi:hypothetical protein